MKIIKKEFFYLSDDNDLSFFKKVLTNRLYRTLIGVFGGTLLGLIYWNYIGCNSGSCPLTSNPYQTTIMGGLIGGIFANDNKKTKK